MLLGAGPGDPELITLRELRWLRRAEVVVSDHLVNPLLLEEAPPRALRIFAGKAGAATACLSPPSTHSSSTTREMDGWSSDSRGETLSCLGVAARRPWPV